MKCGSKGVRKCNGCLCLYLSVYLLSFPSPEFFEGLFHGFHFVVPCYYFVKCYYCFCVLFTFHCDVIGFTLSVIFGITFLALIVIFTFTPSF